MEYYVMRMCRQYLNVSFIWWWLDLYYYMRKVLATQECPYSEDEVSKDEDAQMDV